MLLGGLGVAALLAPAVSAQPKVLAARVGDHGTMTRFVIEATEPLALSYFTLASPDRVVIELPPVQWRVPARVGKTGAGLIAGFRFGPAKAAGRGRQSGGKSRVVLDLRAPAGVKKFFVIPPRGGHGYRFVLDLEKVSRAAFLASLGAAKGGGKAARRMARRTPPPRKVRPESRLPLKPLVRHVVAIDPGHGGIDPGTTGANGAREKQITLAMALVLKRQLEASGRYRVRLTRHRDQFVRLRQRVAKARDSNAELFISLHADAIKNRRFRGASVYTLSEVASDKEAEELAAKENKVDLIVGMDFSDKSPEVTNILIDLAQRETMNYAAQFATMLLSELRGSVKVLRNSHRFAGFAVLKAPDVPSVLVEMGYLSNATDEKLLSSAAYRRKLAAAIIRAMDGFFAKRRAAR
ncbi:MAG: N-acetylmuramoyl-L-alanine amidase [Alphaproteobacteria bacterium]